MFNVCTSVSYSSMTQEKPDCSKKLAEKMLQGWTLLGTNCPNCCVPLVQQSKQDKRMFCVSCEQWAISLSENKVQILANNVDEDHQRASTGMMVTPPGLSAKELKASVDERPRTSCLSVQSDSGLDDEAPMRRALPTVNWTPRKSPSPTKRTKGQPYAEIQKNTMNVLYEKMNALQKQLEESKSTDEIVDVVKAVREVAETIRTVQMLTRS